MSVAVGRRHGPRPRGRSAGRAQRRHPQTLPGVTALPTFTPSREAPAAVQWGHRSRSSSGRLRPGQAPHLAPQVQCPGPACPLLILSSWEPIKCISQARPRPLCASCPPPQALPARARPARDPPPLLTAQPLRGAGPRQPPAPGAAEEVETWRGRCVGRKQAGRRGETGWAFPAGPLAASRPGDLSSRGLRGQRLGLGLDRPRGGW